MNIKHIVIVVVAVVVSSLLTFFITRTATNKDTKVIRNVASNVYDADYSRDINLESYNAIENFSIDDIVLPYINLDSEDAKSINNEFKIMFDELLQLYKSNLESKRVWVTTNYLNYEAGLDNIEDRFMSVIVTKTIGGTTAPVIQQKSYVFNINTKKYLKMNDVISVFKGSLGTDVDMKESIKAMILNHENKSLAIDTTLTSEEKTNLINTAISLFEQLYNTNNLPVYLDNAGRLNIVATIYLANKVENINLIYE